MAERQRIRIFRKHMGDVVLHLALGASIVLYGCGTGQSGTSAVSNSTSGAGSSGSTSSGAPLLTLSGTQLAFPDTSVGAASAAQNITLSNTGTAAATVQSINVTGSFHSDTSLCLGTLGANAKCTMAVLFTPDQSGTLTGGITFATSTGSLTVTASGKGISQTLTVSTAAASLREGESTQFTALLNGASTTQSITWRTDSGSVTTDGTYTASSNVTASTTAHITASLTATPSVTATLALPIGRALPTLTSSTPTQIDAGATTTLTITGTHLSNLSQLMINGQSQSFTKVSDTQISVQAAMQSWDSGSIAIKGSMSGSDGGSTGTLQLSVKALPVSYDAAVRFLQQAAYGATPAAVQQVQQMGMSSWIDQQLKNPAYDYTSTAGLSYGQYYRNTQSLQYSLRQRVSSALSHVYVASGSSACVSTDCGPYWEAVLENDAFGNARTLLKDVAVNPLMGSYLDNANNAAYNGIVPNQNFAREFMQLMTIGTVQLNQDGTAVLDANGQPVPTYTQSNIAEMANALSGWKYARAGELLPQIQVPMVMAEGWHNQGAKNILPGITLPAGQRGEVDLDAVVETLFNHPNYGPFLSRRLIQHLVTSNPSPAYIARIAAVFADDGNGVRGNLGAVVKAILLDKEARKGDDAAQVDSASGHYMEPALYLANVMNAVQGVYTDDQVRNVDAAMGQALYSPSSVFSYYSPDHMLPNGTYAPEAQLLTNANGVTKLGLIYSIFTNKQPGFQVNWKTSPFSNATSTDDFLARVNHLLYHGQMPDSVRTTLTNYIAANTGSSINSMLPDLMFMAVSSAAYQTIQ
ncbi:DUF1800 family protein [Terriglobus albidus]|uniref:DUF1800 family protein n=1 Tax=Terriglobus albidus TaxID=1592106 RepID=A0A5B9ELD2_9BACT|nr:DUF1800 family protein [Terriglobus albidus]QEE30916.1 DUF1800 family protein [Terriglobus albidus]